MSEFMKSNPAIDKAVSESTNFEDIREILKSSLAGQGLISRERGDDYGARVLRQPEAPAPVALMSDEERTRRMHQRVIYPYQNARIVIEGLTEQELDEAEARVRASFGQR